MAMLSFDIRSLTERAAAVDDTLSPDDPVWEEGDPKPSSPLHVKGRLSTAGPGQFYWHGTIEGDVAMELRRCLGGSSAHVSDDAHLIFAEAGTEGVEDDPDVYLIDTRATELDLRPELREQGVFQCPGHELLPDDCQGLCPRCGTELNTGSCDCAPASVDP